jgi:hypothetical protein
MHKKCLFLLTMIAALLPFSRPVVATETGFGAYLPGYRDFLTGVVPPYPGLYLRNDAYFYDGSAGRVVREGRIALDLDIFTFADIITASYVLPGTLLKANVAIGAALPIMHTRLKGDLTTALGTLSREASQTAQGNLILTPLMLGWHHKNFHWNFTTAFFLPTGKYDVNDVVNVGLNFVTIDPELGFTYWDMKRGFDISTAIGYSVNFINQETDYQSGNAFHLDFAAQKTFPFGLRVGAVGYAWIQVQGDSGSGALLGPFKGRIFGAGPAIGWDFKVLEKHQLGLMFKYYREFGAKNHFEGNAFDMAMTFNF